MNPRRLDLDAIVGTTARLRARIVDRFGTRGIAALACELETIAREAEARIERISRPHWPLRSAVGGVFALTVVIVALSANGIRVDARVDGLDEWLQVIESGVQDVVFLGIGVAFLLTLEQRHRRRQALAAIHELRSLCHVIDMHQLTKDPDSLTYPQGRTEHSPERWAMTGYELSRYLDYCSEMLSLAAKVAALYAQTANDPVVLGAVREIQELASDLSSELWQKIVILDRMTAESASPYAPAR
jgi:hypothetical protein